MFECRRCKRPGMLCDGLETVAPFEEEVNASLQTFEEKRQIEHH